MQKIKQSHLTFIVKILIGVLSFWIIYNRLTSLPNLKVDFLFLFTKPSVYCALLLVLFLMPINWGIESYKWKCITMQTELVSYLTALKSVFSGICVGNIAPGRALEFAAKIIFFKQENRPTIAVLHFINGMFQMLITVAVGILSITIKLNQNNQSNKNIVIGQHRKINLSIEPFNLPKPFMQIIDGNINEGRYLNIYKINQILKK